MKIDNHNRSHLKNDFCLNLCVGSSFQLLGILQYACGLNIGPALTLNQNAIFEMTSSSRFRCQGSGAGAKDNAFSLIPDPCQLYLKAQCTFNLRIELVVIKPHECWSL